jgi:hypothetical protein
MGDINDAFFIAKNKVRWAVRKKRLKRRYALQKGIDFS